jgi:hypothetical protein
MLLVLLLSAEKRKENKMTDKTKSKTTKGSNIKDRSKFAEGYQHGVTVGNTYTNPVSKAIEKFGAKNFYGKIPFKQNKKRNAGYDKGVADGEAAQKYKKKNSKPKHVLGESHGKKVKAKQEKIVDRNYLKGR